MADEPFRKTKIAAGITVFAAVVGMLAFFGFRDLAAEERCADLGGQTWDSGAHCVLGDPEIVSTR